MQENKKKFELLTDEELINLTQEEIDWYISLKKAENGIRILKCPEVPQYREVPQPDFESYEAMGMFFEDRETAEEIVNFVNDRKIKSYKENYNWDIGSEKRYLTPFNGSLEQVEKKTLYKEITYNSIKDVLISNENIKKAYEKVKGEYDEQEEKSNDLVQGIYEAISKAKERKELFNEYLEKIQEYLRLANGDKEVAWNFFEKAYTIENTEKNKILEHKDYLEALKGYN